MTEKLSFDSLPNQDKALFLGYASFAATAGLVSALIAKLANTSDDPERFLKDIHEHASKVGKVQVGGDSTAGAEALVQELAQNAIDVALQAARAAASSKSKPT